jgi:hypothetical protein
MPAYTHRWFKTRDTPPNETSFECRAYPVEIIAPDLDTSEVQQQMEHAQQQLAISRQYPGRTPHISRRMFRPRTVK